MSERQTFEELASSGDEIDVAVGAALIARDVYGSIDVPKLLARFDDLAAPIAGIGIDRMNAREAAGAISQHLYGVVGFAGNEADYYDPKNSLLPDVLDRKLGIPISLALVYCEVARRVGVVAEGVGFPGHFLVRVRDAHGADVLVDPFFGGRVLDEAALAALLDRVADQASAKAVLRPEMLEAAPSRTILSRWLMNLRGVYLARGDLPRALLVVDRLVSLSPRDKSLLRDRGLLAARLGATESARADLTRVLAMDPTGDVADELRAALEALDHQKPSASN